MYVYLNCSGRWQFVGINIALLDLYPIDASGVVLTVLIMQSSQLLKFLSKAPQWSVKQ